MKTSLFTVLWISGVVLLTLFLLNLPAQAQVSSWEWDWPLPALPMTDGEVKAIAVSGDTVYIGGTFEHVFPWTGGGVLFNLDEDPPVPIEGMPRPYGNATFACSDQERTGYYVGGYFKGVFDETGFVQQTNLVHIIPSENGGYKVDPNWSATPGGGLERVILDEVDNILYITTVPTFLK